MIPNGSSSSALPPSIERREREIAEELASLPEGRNSKWEWLLRVARESLPPEGELPDEKFLVKGCATPLYLVPEYDGERLWFRIDVDRRGDSPLFAFGLAELARRLYSGQTPGAIGESNPLFFKEIGLIEQLSPQRSNGFASLLRLMRLYATVYARTGKTGD